MQMRKINKVLTTPTEVYRSQIYFPEAEVT